MYQAPQIPMAPQMQTGPYPLGRIMPQTPQQQGGPSLGQLMNIAEIFKGSGEKAQDTGEKVAEADKKARDFGNSKLGDLISGGRNWLGENQDEWWFRLLARLGLMYATSGSSGGAG